MQGCIIIGLACGLIVMMILIILLPAIMLRHFNSLQDINNATSDNWKSDFISDMKLVKQGEPCPSEYTDFITYRWPGTNEGCYCNIQKTLHVGECCHYSCHNGNCRRTCKCFWTYEDIPEIKKRTFNYWKGDAVKEGSRICIKRIPKYNFLTRKRDGITGCKSHETTCGDRFQNSQTYFCVPQDYECPVRSFTLGNKELVINRDNLDLYPLVQLDIEEGGGVCIVPSKKNLADKHTSYILYKQEKEKCVPDQRFKSIDATTEKSFFSINDSMDLQDRLPQLKFKEDVVYNMFYRNVIPIALSCRDKAESFIFINSTLDYLQLCASMLIILGILYLLLLILTCCGFTTMFMYRGLILVIYIIIFVIMYFKLTEIGNIEDSNLQKCFDNETNQFIHQLNDRSLFYLSASFHLAIVLLIGVGEILYLMTVNNHLDCYCFKRNPSQSGSRHSSSHNGDQDGLNEEESLIDDQDTPDSQREKKRSQLKVKHDNQLYF